jgi:glycosyltransferase involved in cell wall biosynthesis
MDATQSLGALRTLVPLSSAVDEDRRPCVLVNAGPWAPVHEPGQGGSVIGGKEPVVARLVKGYRESGYRVVFAGARGSTVVADEYVTPMEPMHGEMGLPYSFSAHTPAYYFDRVLRRIVKGGIDLVDDHELMGPALGSTMALTMGQDCPPMVHTVHWPPSMLRNPFWEEFDGNGKVFFKFVSQVRERSAPEALRRQSLGVIPNGVERPEGLGPPIPYSERRSPQFGLDRYAYIQGDISPTKGQKEAIELSRASGIPLVIAGAVGGVASLDEFNQRVAANDTTFLGQQNVQYFQQHVLPHLGENVRWLGLVGQEKWGWLQNAAATISYDEDDIMSVAEAQAAGTPTIVLHDKEPYDAGTARVVDGRNGYNVAAHDARGFANVLQRLPREVDPAACQRVAQPWTIENMIGGHVETLQLASQIAHGERSLPQRTFEGRGVDEGPHHHQ